MASRRKLSLAAFVVAVGALCSVILVLPGRVCVCLHNASDSSLTAVVSVPSTSLQFTDIAAGAKQCQAVRIVKDGSLDFQTIGTKEGLDYVHADMGGDIHLRYADGAASLDEQREDDYGVLAGRSCW